MATVFVLWAFCSASFGVIWFLIVAPQDDAIARAWAGERPELKPLHAEYFEIIKTRLWPLKFDEIGRIFGAKLATATNWWGAADGDGKNSGPKLDRHPADLVLPLFASKGGPNCFGLDMMVSGLHSTDPAQNKSHTDLYAVGDIGYVEFYSQLDGESVQNAVIYLRADYKFVPLKSTNDFSIRLEWDKARFDELKGWFDAHHVSVKTAPFPEAPAERK